MTRYFLDTTAHIERWAGDQARQERVRSLIGRSMHSTSTHALREWRHIILGGCADILNALRARPRELSEVFARLSQGWGRTPGHRWRVLSLIAAGEKTIDSDLMEIRADSYRRYLADELFHDQIDTVRDGSECGLADNEVRRNAKGAWALMNPTTGSERCKKTDTICRQDQHLGAKETDLRAAGNALLASTAHRKMGQAALTAANDPAERKGKQCYGMLGDVSLALECGQKEVILTTDASFDVIAPALGLTVVRFNPTPPP